MSYSETKIANIARLKSGSENLMIDIDSDQNMRLIFDFVRDSLLASYHWNFAKTRASLVRDVDVPIGNEWAARYTLPSDFINIFTVKNKSGFDLIQFVGQPEYTLESNSILCNETEGLNIVYIRRVQDSSQFHQLFSEALAVKLAFEESESQTNSNTKKQILGAEFQQKVNQAFQIDAISNPPEPLRPPSFVTARL